MQGRVLVIAGSDSGGGAGIQADIKTIAALGGYATTAITALTAQDTERVHAVQVVPAEFVGQQMQAVLTDIGADAVKTGMLGTAEIVETVCDMLVRYAPLIPFVVDPVIAATAGTRLLAADAFDSMRKRLLPMARLVTPNIPEAEMLSGMTIVDPEGMRQAAAAIRDLGVPAVLLKGGHLPDGDVVDLLMTDQGCEAFVAPRIASRHTHGTGCTLASGIAAGLAQGMELRDAVLRARAFVRAAIEGAPGYGGGHGPMNHGVTVDPAKLRWSDAAGAA